MKRLALSLAALATIFAFNLSGCCFGEPEEGQICFIIIPIPGAAADAPGGNFTVERTDCASVR